VCVYVYAFTCVSVLFAYYVIISPSVVLPFGTVSWTRGQFILHSFIVKFRDYQVSFPHFTLPQLELTITSC